jgi:16S rRNA (cytidine1402-2'-O)-methyltransferase
LTKIHEECLHGTLPELLEILESRPVIQGEITLIIERGKPVQTSETWPESIKEHLEQEMSATGLSRNEALKTVANKRGISRRDAYNLLNDELRMTNDE